MITVAIVLIIIGAFAVGYSSGGLNERQAWNKLIDNGTIPKP